MVRVGNLVAVCTLSLIRLARGYDVYSKELDASNGRRCKSVVITAGLSHGADIYAVVNGYGRIGARFRGVDPRSICFYGFEPAAVHTPTLRRLEGELNSAGYDATFFTENALSDVDGTQTFYYTEGSGGKNLTVGGTLSPGRLFNHNHKTVATTNFTRFFMEEVEPLKARYIFVKLDIEGGEFNVLPQIVHNGIACQLDELHVEWHKYALPCSHEKPPCDVPRGMKRNVLPISAQLDVMGLNRKLADSPGCRLCHGLLVKPSAIASEEGLRRNTLSILSQRHHIHNHLTPVPESSCDFGLCQKANVLHASDVKNWPYHLCHADSSSQHLSPAALLGRVWQDTIAAFELFRTDFDADFCSSLG